MGLQKLSLVPVLAAVAAMSSASAARANSVSTVNLDTFTGSGWTVTRTMVGGETNTFTGPAAAVNVADNPGWADFNGPEGQWVSFDSGTGSGYTGDVNGTNYVYSKTFTLANPSDNFFVGPGVFTLTGDFFTDNFTTSVKLDGVELDPSEVSVNLPQFTEFGYRNSINVTIDPTFFLSQTTFTLSISTVNSYADPTNLANGTNPGPTGLEFTGSASAESLSAGGGTPVPTPNAAWMGLSLIGGMGAFAVMRKRRSMV